MSFSVFIFLTLSLALSQVRCDTVLSGLLHHKDACYSKAPDKTYPKGLAYFEIKNMGSQICRYGGDYLRAGVCQGNTWRKLTCGNLCTFGSNCNCITPMTFDSTYKGTGSDETAWLMDRNVNFDSPGLRTWNEAPVIKTRKANTVVFGLDDGLVAIRMMLSPGVPGETSDWDTYVQLRFSKGFHDRVLKTHPGAQNTKFQEDRGIIGSNVRLVVDVDCFMITSAIPIAKRKVSVDSCLTFEQYNYADRFKSLEKNRIKQSNSVSVSDVLNCEQGLSLTEKIEPRDFMADAWKTAITLGISFIPVVGPWLAIGADIALTMLDDKEGFLQVLEQKGVGYSKDARIELLARYEVDVAKIAKNFLKKLAKRSDGDEETDLEEESDDISHINPNVTLSTLSNFLSDPDKF